MNQIFLIVFIFFLAAFALLLFWLFLNRQKKHWIKNKSGEGVSGLKIVIGEIEDTTFNKLTTAGDGGFRFTFNEGQMNIYIEDLEFDFVKVENHKEAIIDGEGGVTFESKDERESVTFIVRECQHRCRRRRDG
jgi:hypothetical protein